MPNIHRHNILIIAISALFLCFPFISSPDFGNWSELVSSYGFKKNIIGTVLVVLCFLLNYYYLIPNFYQSHKYFLYFFLLFFGLILVLILPVSFFPPEIPKIITEETMHKFHKKNSWNARIFWNRTFYEYIISVFTAVLLHKNLSLNSIKEEKLKSELSYLKAQINPHFLFNSLNSIYALTLDKSDEAPEAVLKLSTIMRYVVVESSNEFVSLKKEINYVKDYIDLQKFRMADSVDFRFDISGIITDQKIAPLIFISFIENAFKFGYILGEPSFVHIHMKIHEDVIELNIKNSKSQKKYQSNERSETGMYNSRKRLRYLYPDKYELRIDEDDFVYKTYLKINLK